MQSLIHITPHGYAMLCAEIRYLQNVERALVIKAISDARALGDLSENAEYHAALEKQRQLESRIQYLDNIKDNAAVLTSDQIVDKSVARFGAIITVLDRNTDEETVFKVVSEYEASMMTPLSKDLDDNEYINALKDLQENTSIAEKEGSIVSNNAPIAKYVMGKKVGDTYYVNAPGGAVEYEIIDIYY